MSAIFLDFIEIILNVTSASEKEYKETFVATPIVDIVKDIISSEFLAVTIAQSHYRYTRVVKMILRHESVVPLVINENSDNPLLKNLGISEFDDTWLYM